MIMTNEDDEERMKADACYYQVKELATVSLTNPVKVFVNENKDIAFNLQQEFIRIRPHMEPDREAIVAGTSCT